MELAHVRAVVSTFALATAVFVIGSLLNVTRWSKFVSPLRYVVTKLLNNPRSFSAKDVQHL